MPLSYAIDPDQRLVTITGEYAHPGEWARLLQEVLDDPRREPGFGFLRDLREATSPVDAEAVIGIIEVVKKFWPVLQPAKAAIVTPRRFDSPALIAHALADLEHIPLRMFTEYQSAVDWLRATP
jgi:hypothetical protein